MPNLNTYKPYLKCALHMMEQWPLFLDGVDRVFGFWQNTPQDVYQGIEWTRDREDQLLQIDPDTQYYLNKTSTISQSFKWIEANQLPFITKEKHRLGQLDLFNESLYLVLLVRQELSPGINALYFIFFRENKSNFGMTGNNEAYTTSEKTIIGRMACKHAEMLTKNFLDHEEKMKVFKESTKKLLETKQKKLEAQNDDLIEWKNQWCNQIINDLSQRNGFNYVIHEESRELLFSKCHNLDSIVKSIKNSFVYICNLYDNEPGDEVELEPDFIQIYRPSEVEAKIEQQPITRINKTHDLLDRLEVSANKVLETGLSLTSAEVGKNMDKAITAPAISDALKKNKVRILQLLNEYPQKWSTIRKHFKPVVNLYEKSGKNLHQSS